jgi:hypothetical protein
VREACHTEGGGVIRLPRGTFLWASYPVPQTPVLLQLLTFASSFRKLCPAMLVRVACTGQCGADPKQSGHWLPAALRGSV